MRPVQHIKLAVDAVVFGYQQQKLHVLLVQQKYGIMKGKWVLVGGFVKDEESLSDAVKRELAEEAGVKVDYMEQLYTFGDDVDRDPRFRVVSVAYFSIVNPKGFKLKADSDASDARWFAIDELPDLGYDHKLILQAAQQRLSAKLSYQPIGFDLLPKEFVFSELEHLYSTLLDKSIDRRNFRKKILSFGFIEETGKQQVPATGRPAKLFRFNKQKYHQLVKEGFHFDVSLL